MPLDSGQIVSINNTTVTSFQGQYSIVKLTNSRFTYTQTSTTVQSDNTGTATRIQQVTIAEADTAPTGYNSVVSRFVAYVCIVFPIDHDGVAATRSLWWGEVVVTPVLTSGDAAVWTLGTTASSRKLCRFSGDYVNDGVVSNSEHPRYYRGVSAALDNQNFIVIDGDKTCPTDSEIDTLNADYINTHTLQHQTAAGTTTGSSPSNTASQWTISVESSSAPTVDTDVLPLL
jgi:hypothetical protein